MPPKTDSGDAKKKKKGNERPSIEGGVYPWVGDLQEEQVCDEFWRCNTGLLVEYQAKHEGLVELLSQKSNSPDRWAVQIISMDTIKEKVMNNCLKTGGSSAFNYLCEKIKNIAGPHFDQPIPPDLLAPLIKYIILEYKEADIARRNDMERVQNEEKGRYEGFEKMVEKAPLNIGEDEAPSFDSGKKKRGSAKEEKDKSGKKKSIAGGGKKKSIAGGGKKKSIAGGGKKQSIAGGGKKKSIAGGGKKKSIAGGAKKQSIAGGGKKKSIAGGGKKKSIAGGGKKQSIAGGGKKKSIAGGGKSSQSSSKGKVGGGKRRKGEEGAEKSYDTQTLLTERDLPKLNDKLIADDPVKGPQLYFVLTQMKDPDLPLQLIANGIPLTGLIMFNDGPPSKGHHLWDEFGQATTVEYFDKVRNRRLKFHPEQVFREEEEKLRRFWNSYIPLSHLPANDISFQKTFDALFVPNLSDIDLQSIRAKIDVQKRLYDEISRFMYTTHRIQELYSLYLNASIINKPDSTRITQPRHLILYNSILNPLPQEAYGVPMILDALISQVEFNVDNDVSCNFEDYGWMAGEEPEPPKFTIMDEKLKELEQKYDLIPPNEMIPEQKKICAPRVIIFGDISKWKTIELGKLGKFIRDRENAVLTAFIKARFLRSVPHNERDESIHKVLRNKMRDLARVRERKAIVDWILATSQLTLLKYKTEQMNEQGKLYTCDGEISNLQSDFAESSQMKLLSRPSCSNEHCQTFTKLMDDAQVAKYLAELDYYSDLAPYTMVQQLFHVTQNRDVTEQMYNDLSNSILIQSYNCHHYEEKEGEIPRLLPLRTFFSAFFNQNKEMCLKLMDKDIAEQDKIKIFQSQVEKLRVDAEAKRTPTVISEDLTVNYYDFVEPYSFKEEDTKLMIKDLPPQEPVPDPVPKLESSSPQRVFYDMGDLENFKFSEKTRTYLFPYGSRVHLVIDDSIFSKNILKTKIDYNGHELRNSFHLYPNDEPFQFFLEHENGILITFTEKLKHRLKPEGGLDEIEEFEMTEEANEEEMIENTEDVEVEEPEKKEEVEEKIEIKPEFPKSMIWDLIPNMDGIWESLMIPKGLIKKHSTIKRSSGESGEGEEEEEEEETEEVPHEETIFETKEKIAWKGTREGICSKMVDRVGSCPFMPQKKPKPKPRKILMYSPFDKNSLDSHEHFDEKLYLPSGFDCKISWPNGLFITKESLADDPFVKGIYYVRQQYLNTRKDYALEEEYRCITSNGTVVKFMKNEKYEIYHPCGTIVRLTILPYSGEELDMELEGEEVGGEDQWSRRLLLTVTLTTGQQYTIKKGVWTLDKTIDIFEKFDYRCHTYEVIRSDEMTSLFQEDGSVIVQFPDLTEIRSDSWMDKTEVFPEWSEDELLNWFYNPEYDENENEEIEVELTTEVNETGPVEGGGANEEGEEEEKHYPKIKLEEDGFIMVNMSFFVFHPHYAGVRCGCVNGKAFSLFMPGEIRVQWCDDNINYVTFGKEKDVHFQLVPQKCTFDKYENSVLCQRSVFDFSFVRNPPSLPKKIFISIDQDSSEVSVDTDCNIFSKFQKLKDPTSNLRTRKSDYRAFSLERTLFGKEYFTSESVRDYIRRAKTSRWNNVQKLKRAVILRTLCYSPLKSIGDYWIMRYPQRKKKCIPNIPSTYGEDWLFPFQMKSKYQSKRMPNVVLLQIFKKVCLAGANLEHLFKEFVDSYLTSLEMDSLNTCSCRLFCPADKIFGRNDSTLTNYYYYRMSPTFVPQGKMVNEWIYDFVVPHIMKMATTKYRLRKQYEDTKEKLKLLKSNSFPKYFDTPRGVCFLILNEVLNRVDRITREIQRRLSIETTLDKRITLLTDSELNDITICMDPESEGLGKIDKNEFLKVLESAKMLSEYFSTMREALDFRRKMLSEPLKTCECTSKLSTGMEEDEDVDAQEETEQGPDKDSIDIEEEIDSQVSEQSCEVSTHSQDTAKPSGRFLACEYLLEAETVPVKDRSENSLYIREPHDATRSIYTHAGQFESYPQEDENVPEYIDKYKVRPIHDVIRHLLTVKKEDFEPEWTKYVEECELAIMGIWDTLRKDHGKSSLTTRKTGCVNEGEINDLYRTLMNRIVGNVKPAEKPEDARLF